MKNKKDLDIFFMNKALQFAEKGVYSTHPNPRVGAIVVKNNKILGQGYHRQPGSHHAEYLAIKNSKNSCSSATLYVTLEPCCHFGKTPPCSNLIIESKIKRVVISTIDPNPLVSGKSIKLLRKHGIKVDTGILKNRSQSLNKGFFSRFNNLRPYVLVKSGISLDGKIALQNNDSKWVTSVHSRKNVQKERALCSAILTTSKTILSDNPKFTVRDKSLLTKIKRQPTLVILDSNLKLPSKMDVFKNLNRDIIIFTSKQITKNILSKYKKNVRLFSVPKYKKTLNLHKVMEILSKEELNELLVESGATLIGNLLRESLVDELILYISPKILGNTAKTFSGLTHIQKLSQKINFQINDIIKIDNDLKLHLSRI